MKYSKADREAAARLCSAMAAEHHADTLRSGRWWNSATVAEALGASDGAWRLSQSANAGVMKQERAKVGWSADLDYADCWAEAESRIRTGWSPP